MASAWPALPAWAVTDSMADVGLVTWMSPRALPSHSPEFSALSITILLSANATESAFVMDVSGSPTGAVLLTIAEPNEAATPPVRRPAVTAAPMRIPYRLGTCRELRSSAANWLIWPPLPFRHRPPEPDRAPWVGWPLRPRPA